MVPKYVDLEALSMLSEHVNLVSIGVFDQNDYFSEKCRKIIIFMFNVMFIVIFRTAVS